MHTFAIVLSALVALPVVVAHGDPTAAELAKRDLFAAHTARSLAVCAGNSNFKALHEQATVRRSATLQRLRRARGILPTKRTLHRRDLTQFEAWEEVNHNMTGVFAPDSDPGTLFAANTTCALTPENIVGPYYVLGELERTNLTEGQQAVPMHIDMQFIDISTCAPIQSLLVDVWAANATGVYSGVSASGQGGLNSTFGRGFQITDSSGVVQFDTFFPGHYEGRATHEHVLARANATLNANNTVTDTGDGVVEHIGQLFYDESLRAAVEATYPYNTNTQSVTSNDDDGWTGDSATADYDPFPEWLYVGDDVGDGLLTWISIGIDTTSNHSSNATAAATYLAGGGVDNPDAGFGMPPPSSSATSTQPAF